MEAKANKIPHPMRKLNKKLIDKIVKDISEGSPHCYAAEANGITESIFYVWLDQGKIDVVHGDDSLCAYLVESLAKIKQKEINKCRKAIVSSKKGHKGAEWTLEHAYWRQYSSNVAAIELSKEIQEMKALLGAKLDGDVNNKDA
jgi:hypothetical protein